MSGIIRQILFKPIQKIRSNMQLLSFSFLLKLHNNNKYVCNGTVRDIYIKKHFFFLGYLFLKSKLNHFVYWLPSSPFVTSSSTVCNYS